MECVQLNQYLTKRCYICIDISPMSTISTNVHELININDQIALKMNYLFKGFSVHRRRSLPTCGFVHSFNPLSLHSTPTHPYRYVHGCLQSCNDADACNHSPRAAGYPQRVGALQLATAAASLAMGYYILLNRRQHLVGVGS